MNRRGWPRSPPPTEVGGSPTESPRPTEAAFNASRSLAAPTPTTAEPDASIAPPSGDGLASCDEQPPASAASTAPSRRDWSRSPPPTERGDTQDDPTRPTEAAHEAQCSPAFKTDPRRTGRARRAAEWRQVDVVRRTVVGDERPSARAASTAPSRQDRSRSPPPTEVGGAATELPRPTEAALNVPCSLAAPTPTTAETGASIAPPGDEELTSCDERPSARAASTAPSRRDRSRSPLTTEVCGSATELPLPTKAALNVPRSLAVPTPTTAEPGASIVPPGDDGMASCVEQPSARAASAAPNRRDSADHLTTRVARCRAPARSNSDRFTASRSLRAQLSETRVLVSSSHCASRASTPDRAMRFRAPAKSNSDCSAASSRRRRFSFSVSPSAGGSPSRCSASSARARAS